MGGLLLVIALFILCCILWSLPLYVAVNLVLWVFHISAHFTLLQSFAVVVLINILHNMFFKKD